MAIEMVVVWGIYKLIESRIKKLDKKLLKLANKANEYAVIKDKPVLKQKVCLSSGNINVTVTRV